MMMPWDMPLVAQSGVQYLLRSLEDGVALSLLVGVLLKLAPRQNSATRFAVWFFVLAALPVLPLLGGSFRSFPGGGAGNGGASLGYRLSMHALTVPAGWAMYIFLAWAFLAAIAVFRVVAGLWQVHKLRKNCREIDPGSIDPELGEMMAGAGRSRPVSLCVSDELETPAALGFLKPAVVIPAWLLREASPAEFRQVALHELTHLRRRDDWTNLAQRIAKALLFFHPCAWWIERRLSLEREMACDDAVLAHTASPRSYAQCLARLAEKTFARRRMALAQAAVDRMRHLSLRVAQILDGDRLGTTRLCKPAIPLVMALACLCAFSGGRAPELVSFRENPVVRAVSTPPPQETAKATEKATEKGAKQAAKIANGSRNDIARSDESNSLVKKVGLRPATQAKARVASANTQDSKPWISLASLSAAHQPAGAPSAPNVAGDAPVRGDYVVRREQMVMLTVDQGRQILQLRLWEVRVLLPSPSLEKRTSRKSI